MEKTVLPATSQKIDGITPYNMTEKEHVWHIALEYAIDLF
jgi:hypothetical protein